MDPLKTTGEQKVHAEIFTKQGSSSEELGDLSKIGIVFEQSKEAIETRAQQNSSTPISSMSSTPALSEKRVKPLPFPIRLAIEKRYNPSLRTHQEKKLLMNHPTNRTPEGRFVGKNKISKESLDEVLGPIPQEYYDYKNTYHMHQRANRNEWTPKEWDQIKAHPSNRSLLKIYPYPRDRVSEASLDEVFPVSKDEEARLQEERTQNPSESWTSALSPLKALQTIRSSFISLTDLNTYYPTNRNRYRKVGPSE